MGLHKTLHTKLNNPASLTPAEHQYIRRLREQEQDDRELDNFNTQLQEFARDDDPDRETSVPPGDRVGSESWTLDF